MNPASSKPARDKKGDQLLSVLAVGTSGGVFGGTGVPYLLQRRPVKNKESVMKIETIRTIQHGVIVPP
jgi:hypothetical protein